MTLARKIPIALKTISTSSGDSLTTIWGAAMFPLALAPLDGLTAPGSYAPQYEKSTCPVRYERQITHLG